MKRGKLRKKKTIERRLTAKERNTMEEMIKTQKIKTLIIRKLRQGNPKKKKTLDRTKTGRVTTRAD